MDIINAKGKSCPIPVIMAKKEVDQDVNEFSILVDNNTAVENLKRFAANSGYFSAVEIKGENYEVVFRKSGDGIVRDVSASGKSWAVFLGREGIGEGDVSLGASLLKMYLYTLTQGADLPDYILMMNGGVKIAVEQEQAIEHLRELEGRGVTILVCGACLNFFGITEAVKAGTVSNMYDIVTAMNAVDKVVTL